MSTESIRSEVGTAAGTPETNGRLSTLAEGVIGSEILKIASDIRALTAAGKRICNLTVGDFSPTEFRPPDLLCEQIHNAVSRGETHYPPSDGVLALRKAIQSFYETRLGLCYPLESILVHGGSRPGIYASYQMIVDRGDPVIYPVPSWNNNHYSYLVGAEQRPIPCTQKHAFLPTAEEIKPLIRGARLLALNSPLNPTGTAFTRGTLEAICDLVLEENAGRNAGERPLYVVYDQVYWMLTFGKTRHYHPVGLRTEMQRYTIYIDGISKAFASTGLRVGWTVGPPDIVLKMGNMLAHVGAWAPRPEQTAAAALLGNADAVTSYNQQIKGGVQQRLDALYEGISELSDDGFPVAAIEPMGAIYLSVRFALNGRQTKDGRILRTNEEIRQYLLEASQMAIVPFLAFGSSEEDGWFRLSVGAVSLDDIREMFPRLRVALSSLK